MCLGNHTKKILEYASHVFWWYGILKCENIIGQDCMHTFSFVLLYMLHWCFSILATLKCLDINSQNCPASKSAKIEKHYARQYGRTPNLFASRSFWDANCIQHRNVYATLKSKVSIKWLLIPSDFMTWCFMSFSWQQNGSGLSLLLGTDFNLSLTYNPEIFKKLPIHMLIRPYQIRSARYHHLMSLIQLISAF